MCGNVGEKNPDRVLIKYCVKFVLVPCVGIVMGDDLIYAGCSKALFTLATLLGTSLGIFRE